MDKTTFRILSTLSGDLGSPVSINTLTGNIRKLHKTAYYKNIYDKIRELEKQDIIKLERIGKSSIITLNFNNYLLTDLLTEMELKKKENFLKNRAEMWMLFQEMETYFRQGFCLINSISIIKPEKNIPLNRAEFLFILTEPSKWRIGGEPGTKEQFIQNEILNIHLIMQSLQKAHNIKLDYLVLRENEFLELLEERQSNPLKEMLSDQIALFHPQDYWIEMKRAVMKGIRIERREEVKPAKIPEQDLVYNLSGFGYKEIGTKIREGKELCLEYIIVSILIKGDARRIEAVPILLAKSKPKYSLLMFLCKKYEKLEKLLGLLKVLNKIVKSKETGNAIKILETIKIKEEKADEKAIREKMRLYHAI